MGTGTNQPKIGDRITWLEFAGTEKERRCQGKILSEKDEEGGYEVEYFRPARAWVHEDKILKEPNSHE